MDIGKAVWTGMILLTGSIMDLRKQKLPYVFLLACALGSIVLAAVKYQGEWLQTAGGVLLGGSILLFGKWSGCIGMADGIFITMLGILYGAAGSGEQVLYAVFLTALAAVWLITVRGAEAKTRVPFLPFLTAGFVIYMLRFIVCG
ncbi:MAG: prepilin peptidase [Lachnospiraceae bacterium]|nr:prepilin peptidase [Lachnospiraceae bacterium]